MLHQKIRLFLTETHFRGEENVDGVGLLREDKVRPRQDPGRPEPLGMGCCGFSKLDYQSSAAKGSSPADPNAKDRDSVPALHGSFWPKGGRRFLVPVQDYGDEHAVLPHRPQRNLALVIRSRDYKKFQRRLQNHLQN